ncbi:cobyric acid synthase [Methanolapillus millepedarum]|uniref:Probable cobyric acid synthase n=1 Tax=Methanolapillus millepedarum TaxID=3028296 RepID=A0AA96V3M6_9EURY|nr:Cobyric acid synthase [Methanosarcinaceae archaeon Ac7]
MNAKTLLVLGTSSDAGKSSVVTAICKILSEKYKVAPFKAQNMSLNSWVSKDGKEISFAQVIQAWAAGAEPIPEMNPVVLKPKGDSISQVIVLGEHYADRTAGNYYESIDEMFKILNRALSKLEENFDVIVMEGAGGAAEINLYDRDIVNIGTARLTKAPIILVGDIERGGVFASLYGTIALLPEDVRQNVKGFVINKFRGDPAILKPGLDQLEKMTGIPVLGVLPYFKLRIPSEDSMSFHEKAGSGAIPEEKKGRGQKTGLEIAVIQLPKISHFNDFEVLESEALVRYVQLDDCLKNKNTNECPDLILLPGSGTPLQDLNALKESGMMEQILELRKEYNCPVIGVGEGYQLLGKTLTDPSGNKVAGFGLLECDTVYEKEEGYSEKPERVTVVIDSKSKVNAGILKEVSGMTVDGFLAHSGKTTTRSPVFGNDGAVSADGMVLGTFTHGLFDNKQFRKALLRYLAARKGIQYVEEEEFTVQDGFAELAAVFEKNVDMKAIYKIMELK